MRLILTSKDNLTDDHHIHQNFPTAFRCKAIYLSSVSIPYSFYNLRSSNNQLTVNDTLTTIPEKNYSSRQLATTLGEILGTECSFDKQTIKYTITNNTQTSIKISFSSSHRIFGFPENQEYTIPVGEILTSPFVADINDGLQCIILTSNIGNAHSSLYNGLFGTQIIARIPIANHRNGEIIQYQNRFNSQAIVKDYFLQNIEIQIRDDNLDPIHLNGVQMQMEFFIDLENDESKDDFRSKAEDTKRSSEEDEAKPEEAKPEEEEEEEPDDKNEQKREIKIF